MNIKFRIENKGNNFYDFSIIHIDTDFLNYIDDKVIHINFKTKKIKRDDTWNFAYVNKSHFSIYPHINYATQLDTYNNHQIFRLDTNRQSLYNGRNNSRIFCDIKDFDKILIEGFKALSEAYNKRIKK
jgi:hypothetical protein